jgi:hypothetical protein
MSPRPDSAQVRLLPPPERHDVPRTGAVESVQRAEATLSEDVLVRLWEPDYLERLARAYWRYLTRISLGLLQVVYERDSRTVVLLFRPLALLRFRAPEYETSPDSGQVTWRIDRGLLVARRGRGRGYLRIAVKRTGADRVRLEASVANFYPLLRGEGWFARFGTWLYGNTQLRLHVLVTNGFLRSLADFDLPPPRAGAPRSEADAGARV